MTRTRFSGVSGILLATVVAGASTYIALAVTAAVIGPTRYATFSVYWGALYLIIGTLSGVQQEVSRATVARAADRARSHVARNFGAVAATCVAGLVLASAPLWAAAAIPGATWSMVFAIACGAGCYAIVATLSGTLYGLERWAVLAWMIAVDGVLRFAAIVVVLAAGGGDDALAWAAALPFPVTLIGTWLLIRRSVVGASALDVGYRELSWNTARTLIAAAAMSSLISGFPLLLGATTAEADQAQLGVVILAVTLSRAPLVIPVLSLQSYFIVRFKEVVGALLWRRVATAAVAIVGVALVLAVLAALIGPWLLTTVFGEAYALEGVLLGGIVASAGFTAVLCVTGPAVLARGRHTAYSAGWVVAAAVTVLVLVLPLEFHLRVILAMVCGPILGVVVHLGYLAWTTARTPEEPLANR